MYLVVNIHDYIHKRFDGQFCYQVYRVQAVKFGCVWVYTSALNVFLYLGISYLVEN